MRRWVTVIAFVTAACASTITATTPTPSSAPWHVFTVPRSAAPQETKTLPLMRISVPAAWTIAPNDGAWFKRVAKSYDDGGRIRLLFLAEAQDLDSDPTATVRTWHLDADYTVEDIASATFGTYFDVARALMIEARSTDVAGLRVRRQEIRFESTSAQRETLWALQYFATRGREAYVLEFLAPFEERGNLSDLLDAIAATLVLP